MYTYLSGLKIPCLMRYLKTLIFYFVLICECTPLKCQTETEHILYSLALSSSLRLPQKLLPNERYFG